MTREGDDEIKAKILDAYSDLVFADLHLLESSVAASVGKNTGFRTFEVYQGLTQHWVPAYISFIGRLLPVTDNDVREIRIMAYRIAQRGAYRRESIIRSLALGFSCFPVTSKFLASLTSKNTEMRAAAAFVEALDLFGNSKMTV